MPESDPITDPPEALIPDSSLEYLDKMRELCEENGQYIQRKIRGNHVAVVDTGRAGPRVSIKDEYPVQISDLGNRCRATGARDWRAAGEDRAAATIAGNKFSTEKEQAPRWGAATIEVADNDVQKPGTAYPTACSGFSFCLVTKF